MNKNKNSVSSASKREKILAVLMIICFSLWLWEVFGRVDEGRKVNFNSSIQAVASDMQLKKQFRDLKNEITGLIERNHGSIQTELSENKNLFLDKISGSSGGVSVADSNKKDRNKAIVMSCQWKNNPINKKKSDWHGENTFLGVKNNVIRLNEFGSKLKMLVYNFKEEKQAHKFCLKLQKEYPSVNLHCILVNRKSGSGYGLQKVKIILDADADEIMWLDCDSGLLVDPEYLFDDPGYLKTGAMFYADIEDHFSPPPEFLRKHDIQVYKNFEFYTNLGFDSCFMLLDLKKNKKAQKQLRKMLKDDPEKKWYSMGDKDLWHVAWMKTKSPFKVQRFVGGVGIYTDRFVLTSQLKWDDNQVPVIWHQQHRLSKNQWRIIPEYTKDIIDRLYPYLYSMNPPLIQIKVDLHKFRHAFDERRFQWNKVALYYPIKYAGNKDVVSATPPDVLEGLNKAAFICKPVSNEDVSTPEAFKRIEWFHKSKERKIPKIFTEGERKKKKRGRKSNQSRQLEQGLG